MKGNRFLKLLSYFLIPILIAVIIISVFYELGKEHYNEEKYFSSDEFVYDYMMSIRSVMNYLIFKDIEYGSFVDRRNRYNTFDV